MTVKADEKEAKEPRESKEPKPAAAKKKDAASASAAHHKEHKESVVEEHPTPAPAPRHEIAQHLTHARAPGESEHPQHPQHHDDAEDEEDDDHEQHHTLTKEERAAKRRRGPTGIVALILNGERIRRTTNLDEVLKALEAKKTTWIELNERNERGEKLLSALKVHPLAAEDLWNDIGLPKIEDFADYLQIVMHGVREEDVAGNDVPLKLAELDILIGHHWIVTHAHDEKVCAIAPIQAEVLRNHRLLAKGPAWIAHALLDRMVDEYLPVVQRFDAEIEDVETRILEGTLRSDRTTIARVLRVKRSLQMLRRTTIYQREILMRLARAEFDEIPRECVPFYRDVYDHFTRITELVDSYRDLVTSLLEAHFSMQSNRMNEIMKRLTLISTIMLPLTLIAGIYGMNFKGEFPEIEWRYGYFYALGLMATVAIGIIVYFKKKHWL